MKTKVFVIGLVLLLLPFTNLAVGTGEEKISSAPAIPAEPGVKLHYDIDEFNIGEGILNLLQEMFESDPDAPDISFELLGSLEGSEIIAYISYMGEKYLTNGEEDILVELLQPIFMLNLKNDFGVYVNLEDFSIPDEHLIINPPDMLLTLFSGSLIPFFGPPPTMFTTLDFSLMDYSFNYSGYGWDYYYPFSDALFPFGLYVPDTNWEAYDGLDFSDGGMSIVGILDEENDKLTIIFTITDADLTVQFTVEYDIISGYLTLFDFSLILDGITDGTIDIGLSVNGDKTQKYSIDESLVGESWSYAMDTFTFDYDISPEVDEEFLQGLEEFKNNSLNGIGNNFLTVDFVETKGLWGYFDLHLYNPGDPADEGVYDSYDYPMLVYGPVVVPDWDHFEGLATAANSIVKNTEYLNEFFTKLSADNPAFITLDTFILEPHIGTYYSSSQDIYYYYLEAYALVDAVLDDENGTLTAYGMVDLVFYLAYDDKTGVLLGSGVELDFDIDLTYEEEGYSPENLYFNGYFELSTSKDDKTFYPYYNIPEDLDDDTNGDDDDNGDNTLELSFGGIFVSLLSLSFIALAIVRFRK